MTTNTETTGTKRYIRIPPGSALDQACGGLKSYGVWEMSGAVVTTAAKLSWAIRHNLNRKNGRGNGNRAQRRAYGHVDLPPQWEYVPVGGGAAPDSGDDD